MRMHRATLLAGMFATVIGFSGCKRSEAPTQESSGASKSADAVGPDAKPGVTAGAARLVLPIVQGRPGVAYFRVANNTPAKITLAGVHVQDVGKAEMHRTSGGKMTRADHVDIAPGGTIAFAPGGLHVMAFDIAPRLAVGAQIELTLTFSDGDKISIPAKVVAMGDDSGGVAGMSH